MLNTAASRPGVSAAEVGQRIKAARVAAGFRTQEALAEAAGISQATVSRAENGEDVSTLVLHRIATVTGKGLDYFFSQLGNELAVHLRAPEGASQAVTAAIEFATQLLRDFRFVQELFDDGS